jgi:sulfur carrier protein ThiS
MPTVRAEVVGEGVEEVDLASDATYGDVLAALDFSPHEATVLVDDAPVPEDRPVDADRVRVLRLVKGGAADERAVRVRVADAADLLDVMRTLDGAMLAVDADAVRDRIDSGAVLVATMDDRPVGALVRDGDRVTAVATRRRHRDRGVGSALIAAALETRGRLVAAFDPDVRPFYASLGFDIEAVAGEDGRLRGTLREPPRDGDANLVRPVEEGDGEQEDGSREVPGEAG